MQQVLGPGIESHLVVRYSLVALIGVATYGAVHATTKSGRWAAAASLSLVFTYPVGWTFHEWATQTLLLCAACMFALQAAIGFFERPGVRNAVLLGLAFAFGLYAKFSFPLMAGGLLLAALSMPETRRKLGDMRLLIVPVVVAAAFIPYGLWVMQVQGDVVTDLAGHLTESASSHGRAVLKGLQRLAVAIPQFLLPWAAIVLLLGPQAVQRAPAGAPPPSLGERLALRTMLFALLFAVAGTVVLGATNIAARYMHPILFIAPVYVFARIARLTELKQAGRFALAALIAALVLIGARIGATTDNPLTRRADRGLLVPYAELADAVAARGLDKGLIVTGSVRDAGNLRAFLPHLRVRAVSSLRVKSPPRRQSGQDCVLLWEEAQSEWASPQIMEKAERIAVPSRDRGIVAMSSGAWRAMPIDPTMEVCN